MRQTNITATAALHVAAFCCIAIEMKWPNHSATLYCFIFNRIFSFFFSLNPLCFFFFFRFAGYDEMKEYVLKTV